MKFDIKVLKDNYEATNESFIYYLHEKESFNTQKFWEYFNCLKDLTKLLKNDNIERELGKMINKTYSYILKSVIYSLHDEDMSCIKDLPVDELSSYIERLDIVVDACFSGYEVNENLFDDELDNPIIK